jgi:hypothetical protein
MAACKLCSLDPRTVEEAFASGANDRAIARQFNISAMSVGRHRRLHLLRVAQDRVTLLTKDREARAERQAIAAAAASDAPPPSAVIEAMLGLQAQAKKLDSIEQRLERMAVMSEQEKSASSVAQLSAQQLRSVEVGARLGQVGGYAAPRNVGPGGGDGTRFSIVINLAPGKQINIAAVATPQHPGANEIEGEIAHELDGSGDPV